MPYSDADRRMAKVYGVTPEALPDAIARSERRIDRDAEILANQRRRIADGKARRGEK